MDIYLLCLFLLTAHVVFSLLFICFVDMVKVKDDDQEVVNYTGQPVNKFNNRSNQSTNEHLSIRTYQVLVRDG